MMVLAAVLEHARLVTEQPAALVVTVAEVARSYVDVADVGPISVRSNSPGYLLEFAVREGLFRRIAPDAATWQVDLEPWSPTNPSVWLRRALTAGDVWIFQVNR